MAIFTLYLVYYWWDMRQLRLFCDDVKAGTPIIRLSQIAEHHGINSKWIKGDGAYNEKENYWSFYVPSAASVGSNVCAIKHNKVTVISSVIEID